MSLFLGLLWSCNTEHHDVVLGKVAINDNWSYLEDALTFDALNSTTEEWVAVSIPHTWNAEDTMDSDPGYRRDVGWYKKTLEIPSIQNDINYTLYFEGVNMTSEVYINGQLAGSHTGGYLGFDIDITSLVKAGSNEVLVKVDNGYNPDLIPSQKSDFFLYGGITRDVFLITRNATFISDVKIKTPTVTTENAAIEVIAAINGSLSDAADIKVSILDPNEKEVVSQSVKISDSKTTINIENITAPLLWHVDSPNLYTAHVSLMDAAGQVLDESKEKFGLRWFEFKEHGAFYLNGERLLLRGTHRHEEHAGVGPAMSNEQHLTDMQQIKEMGANFVRLAHYPQDPEVYKACDELGLLVWDELPWCRGGLGGDTWKSNTKDYLKKLINQNYNHPSIILWSLGNEIYWLPDFEGGDDTEQINDYLKELHNFSRELDPSRPTAIRKYYEGADIVDVFSPLYGLDGMLGTTKLMEKPLKLTKKNTRDFCIRNMELQVMWVVIA